MARKTSTTPSRIWKYGLPFGPDPEDAHAVADQIVKARIYRNVLIAIERRRRERFRELRLKLVPDFERAQAAYDEACAAVRAVQEQINKRRAATRGRPDVSDLNKLKRELQASKKEAHERQKAARKAANQNPALKEQAAQIDAEAAEESKLARAESGVYWGTYLRIEEAFQRMCRGASDPEHKSWGGTLVSLQDGSSQGGDGSIGVQIQSSKRMRYADLVGCKDSRLRLELGIQRGRPGRKTKRPASQKARLWMRIGSDGRNPVWAHFDMVYHRPLPQDAEIKAAWVQRRQVATRWRWELCLSIESETFNPPQRVPGARCAINFGWRKCDPGLSIERLRVGYLAGTDGERFEITCPARAIERIQYSWSVQEIRDKALQQTIKTLSAWIDSADRLPDWFVEQTKTLPSWRSHKRLASLGYRWRSQRFKGDDTGFALIITWVHRDRHLHQIAANNASKARAMRREHYRVQARKVLDRYSAVIFDGVDLAKLAKRGAPGEEPEQAQRQQRFLAAPGELKAAFTLAASNLGLEVVVAPKDNDGRTQTCHVCGHVCGFDAAASIEHTCEQCGATWDQDDNHVRNLLSFSTAQAAE